MSARRKVLNDLSKLATGTAGVLQGAYGEAEAMVRQRLEALLDKMDIVTREEFDAVKAMAAAARVENEKLAMRLDKLEGKTKPASRATPKKATTTKKPAPAKKAAAKPKTIKKPANKKAAAKKPTAKKPTVKKVTTKKLAAKPVAKKKA